MQRLGSCEPSDYLCARAREASTFPAIRTPTPAPGAEAGYEDCFGWCCSSRECLDVQHVQRDYEGVAAVVRALVA